VRREGAGGSGGSFLCLLPDDYNPSSATSLLPHDDDTRHEDNDDPTTSDKTDFFPPKPLTSDYTSELQIFSLTPTHTLTLMFFLSFSDTPRWIAEMAIGKLKVSSPYFRRLTILFWMMKSAGPEQELAAVWWRLTNFVWRLFWRTPCNIWWKNCVLMTIRTLVEIVLVVLRLKGRGTWDGFWKLIWPCVWLSDLALTWRWFSRTPGIDFAF